MQSLVAIYIIVPLLLILFALWAFMLITTTVPRRNRTQHYQLPMYQLQQNHVNNPISGGWNHPQRAPRTRELPAPHPQRPPFAHLPR